jgi:hypothetical protein
MLGSMGMSVTIGVDRNINPSEFASGKLLNQITPISGML